MREECSTDFHARVRQTLTEDITGDDAILEQRMGAEPRRAGVTRTGARPQIERRASGRSFETGARA